MKTADVFTIRYPVRQKGAVMLTVPAPFVRWLNIQHDTPFRVSTDGERIVFEPLTPEEAVNERDKPGCLD